MPKSRRKSQPNLMEREATGGAIALGGLHFQANVALACVAGWLAQDGFEALTMESMGDVEGKFFVPGKGYELELVEVKDHELSGTEFWAEIRRFQSLDNAHPGVYRTFTLVCDGVPVKLSPLLNGLRRVRSPWSFYEGADSIQVASYEGYINTAKRLNRTVAEARFLFDRVHVEIDTDAARKHGADLFIGVLCKFFPEFNSVGRSQLELAHTKLKELAEKRINKPIDRLEIENTLHSAVDALQRPSWRLVHLHTALHDNEQHTTAITFRWERFFGADERRYPATDEWNSEILSQLTQTHDWIARHRGARRTRLTGHRRLSASLAIGSVLRAVAGFAIEMEVGSGELWRTDDYANATTPDYALEEELRPGIGTRLVVEIAVIREISLQVSNCLASLGLADSPRLRLTSNQPIVSAQQANLIVQKVKQSVDRAIQQTACKEIHLFLAGPAFLALLLGHRLNAIGPIQCYEWIAPDNYAATCRLMP